MGLGGALRLAEHLAEHLLRGVPAGRHPRAGHVEVEVERVVVGVGRPAAQLLLPVVGCGSALPTDGRSACEKYCGYWVRKKNCIKYWHYLGTATTPYFGTTPTFGFWLVGSRGAKGGWTSD